MMPSQKASQTTWGNCRCGQPLDSRGHQWFRVLLLRRFRCQLPLSSASCRCGQPLDSRGHHRGACATTGVLGRRGCPLESCAARICREAGARVSVNIRVQDLDLLPGPRATVVWKWSLMVCLSFTAHSWPWAPRWSAPSELTELPGGNAERDGAALDQARRTKERTYPELTGEHGRARLVVLACETGGRWSQESHSFLRQLAQARAQSEPREMRAAARRAWFRWWCTALACCAAQAFAFSLFSVEEVWGLMGRSRRPLTSSGMTVTGASSELSAHVF